MTRDQVVSRLWIASCLVLGVIAGRSDAQSLPDFTALVDKSAPAVVNIESIETVGARENGEGAPSQEEVPELFRRFFDDPRLGGQRPEQDRRSGGSGFIISADGYIITNHHVVDGADDVRVTLKDRRGFKAKVIGSDSQSDVALLKVEANGLPVLPLGDSDKVKPGQWALAIGSPFGFSHTVTAGIVSAVGRSLTDDQRYVPFIQNDLAINRGNSGGPLFNLEGQVIGINSQIFSQTGGSVGISFAIPINYANQIVQQLKSKGFVSRGYLGVTLQRIDSDTATALKLPRVAGALVTRINPGTPGAKAGLKERDVILTFNGTAIDDSGELPPLVGATAPGTRVSLGVFRDGKQISVPVVVAELPKNLAQGGAIEPGPESAGGQGAYPSIGIAVAELSEDERQQLGLDDGEGVLLRDVTGTAARRAGLRAGDVILMADRIRVGSLAQFDQAVSGWKPGQPLMLLIRRDQGNAFVTFTPEQGE